MLGGWRLSNIFLIQSGPFETPYFSNGDPSGTGSGLIGRPQHPELFRTQSLEAKQDRLANGAGKLEIAQLLALPSAFRAKDVATVERFLEQLLKHEGIALAPVVQKAACLAR